MLLKVLTCLEAFLAYDCRQSGETIKIKASHEYFHKLYRDYEGSKLDLKSNAMRFLHTRISSHHE